VSPIVFAVLRLTTSSNLVGLKTALPLQHEILVDVADWSKATFSAYFANVSALLRKQTRRRSPVVSIAAERKTAA
jgi:hypothetical protein